MNFKAAVLLKKKKIDIMKLYLPKLRNGQTLVKILYSSICHTQIQEIDGLRGRDHFLPHCLGHEGVGIVVDKHPSVKKVKNSDYVCLSWINSKGINAGGVQYTTNTGKKVNAGPVHTFCEYAIISENKIYKIQNTKNIKQKVLFGCALPTAFNVINDLSLKKTKSICITGCGGLGISSIIASKIHNIKDISTVDFNLNKLKIAKKCGANSIYNNLSKITLLKKRFDAIIECTGNIGILHQCLELTKKFGGKIIVIGNYPKGKILKINPWHIIQGKTLSGAWNNQSKFDDKFKKFENKLKNKNLNFYFGKKTYKLDEINFAIKDFKSGKMIRPLIKL